jgi:hypothetical protein
MINSFGWHTAEATPPMVSQGFKTVWPPVTDVPASAAQSLKPFIIRGMIVSRSFSVIFVETATWQHLVYHQVWKSDILVLILF